jgi:hypothetical protein
LQHRLLLMGVTDCLPPGTPAGQGQVSWHGLLLLGGIAASFATTGTTTAA